MIVAEIASELKTKYFVFFARLQCFNMFCPKGLLQLHHMDDIPYDIGYFLSLGPRSGRNGLTEVRPRTSILARVGIQRGVINLNEESTEHRILHITERALLCGSV